MQEPGEHNQCQQIKICVLNQQFVAGVATTQLIKKNHK